MGSIPSINTSINPDARCDLVDLTLILVSKKKKDVVGPRLLKLENVQTSKAYLKNKK